MRVLRAVVGTICLLVASTCVAQKPETAIRAEVQRLNAIVAKAGDGEMWKDVKPMATESLANCEAALDRGRVYLSLLELVRAERLVTAASYGDGQTKDGAGFENQWKDERAKLATFTSRSPGTWKAPLAARALEEAARGQVMPTVNAAKAYAPVTEVKYGFFYMGDAQALADFSRTVREMQFAEVPSAPRVGSIAPELRELQQKANAAFKPPLSRDKHSQFIRLNSTLKVAEELDGARLYAGSWYEYLMAVVQYSTLKAQPIDATKQNALRERIAAELKKPAPSGVDDSLRRLFLEQAEAAVVKAPASAEDLGRASAIVDEVLPAYAELVSGAKKAPTKKATQLATVTLVRWPYT